MVSFLLSMFFRSVVVSTSENEENADVIAILPSTRHFVILASSSPNSVRNCCDRCCIPCKAASSIVVLCVARSSGHCCGCCCSGCTVYCSKDCGECGVHWYGKTYSCCGCWYCCCGHCCCCGCCEYPSLCIIPPSLSVANDEAEADVNDGVGG